MFEVFWNKNRHKIQFLAILTAIGAIFLSIPLPEDKKARVALLNVQSIWLIIISISVFLLFHSLWNLASTFEEKAKKKNKIDIGSTISVLIILIGFFLLSNLWVYLVGLYKEQLSQFLLIIIIGASSLVASILYHISKIVEKHYKDKKWRIYHKFLRVAVLFLYLTVLFIVFPMIGKGLSLPSMGTIVKSLISSFLFILMMLPLTIFFEERINKKQKISTLFGCTILILTTIIVVAIIIFYKP